MTNNEAYCKGLDDAENNVIAKFEDFLNDRPSPVFANPKLEDLRQKIHKKFDDESKRYSKGIDLVSEQFGKILKGNCDPPVYGLGNKQLEKVNGAYLIFMPYIHEASGGNSPIGRKIKRDLEKAIDILNN